MKFLVLAAACLAVAVAGPTRFLVPESAGPVIVDTEDISVGPALIKPEEISVGPVVVEPESISVGPAIIDQEYEQISVGPAVVDQEYEPISVGPAVVDQEYEPISVGPAVVDQEYESISVGPAVIDNEPISVGPALIDPEVAVQQGSPLVQVVININSQSHVIEIPAEGAQIPEAGPAIIAPEIVPEPVDVVEVDPVDVINVAPAEIGTPVLPVPNPIVVDPAQTLPEQLN